MWQGLSDLQQEEIVGKMKVFERLLAYLLFIAIVSLTYVTVELYCQVKTLNWKLDKVVLQVNFIEYFKGYYMVSINPDKIYREGEKSWN